MMTKRVLLRMFDHKWRMSYSLIRSLCIRNKLIPLLSAQTQSSFTFNTILTSNLSSKIGYHGCLKASENMLSNCLCIRTRSIHTVGRKYNNAESKTDLNKEDNTRVSSKGVKNHTNETLSSEPSVLSKVKGGEERNTQLVEADIESIPPPGEPMSLIDKLIHNDPEDSIGTSTTQSTDLSTRVSEKSVLPQSAVQKVRIPPLYSVAPIVNESEVLKNLVELGVDMSVYVEKGVAEKLILKDFELDVKPYVMLLYNAGVPKDCLGTVLTKNPYIFEHDLEHLQVRFDYLLSKRFTTEQIGQMLHRESIFICMETKRIDAKLGFYQKEFRLKGTELRNTATRYAKLLTKSVQEFKSAKVYMKEFLGFNDSELKLLFLISPKTYFRDMSSVSRKFDYLHNVMGLTHQQIALEGWVLNKSTIVLQIRHRFLLKLGRAQYDPKKENYISLDALMYKDKEYFCVEVAKASVMEFDEFQRLI